MLVALIARDKPGALPTRKENRQKHLDYIDATGIVEQAGALLNDAGEMMGSLIILEVPDMATAKSWAAGDPYAAAGLFESVELIQWNRVIE